MFIRPSSPDPPPQTYIDSLQKDDGTVCINVVRDGLIVVGTPIGTNEYISKILRDKMRKDLLPFKRIMPKIGQIMPAAALALSLYSL